MEQNIKMKPKIIRFKPRFNLLYAYECTHKDGTLFKSAQEMNHAKEEGDDIKTNMIVYCKYCRNGVRVSNIEQYMCNVTIAPVLRRRCGYPFYYDPTEEVEGEGLVIMGEWKCPYCGKTAEVDTSSYGCYVQESTGTFELYSINNFSDIARISSYYNAHELESIRYWPQKDGKVAFEIRQAVAFPLWLNGYYKLHIDTIRYRIVFNLKTGLSYLFRGIDLKGKVSKYLVAENEPRIRRFSLLDKNIFNSFTFLTAVEYAKNDVMKTIIRILENEMRVKCDLDLPFLRLYLQNINDEQFVLIKYMANEFDNSPALRKEFRVCRKFLDEKSFNVFPVYCRKKSIKKRILKNPLSVFFYKALHGYGFRDVNILNDIVDALNVKVCLCHSQRLDYLFPKNKASKDMMKWLIKSRGEKEAKVLFIDFMQKDTVYFRDSINSYAELSNIKKGTLPVIRGNYKALHDKLSDMLYEEKTKNIPISYTEEELALSGIYGEYDVSPAKDTYELFDVGKKMHICVGTYGYRAVSKQCIIAIMRHRDKYVACIELWKDKRENKFILKQLKESCNNVCTHVKPAQEWVCEKGIVTEGCYDYERMLSYSQKGKSTDAQTAFLIAQEERAGLIAVPRPLQNNELDDFEGLPF